MKRLILLASMLCSMSAFSNVYLSSCQNYTSTGVSYSYESCVNVNFNQIDAELGTYLSSCMNIGDEVSYSFTSCIERNFRTVDREVPELWLSSCMNFDRTTLGYSFISCVNRNFSTIQRQLNSRPQD